jgi:Fe-S-cluster-containing dehydrogenase component/DMSO reductase anchor subunit
MTAVLDDTTTLIDKLLAEQQRLTAVERFSEAHDRHDVPAQAKYYRQLLPTRSPAPGEQYAFAVDLDLCSGCKACVTACHNLNGLEEEETWRSVGLLIGDGGNEPFQQTVTTSCHHCLEPACLEGCPVLAYEKDPRTGIVRHLDDQCIGCQYCILKCPYDVPKYSSRRGIVRKCDMCASRLAVDEAPACAQACPNQAIRITLVDVAAVKNDAQEGIFLPGAPDPGYTQPTTRYQSKRTLSHNVLPADAHALKPAHSHPALIFMLVLTQLSVGLFCVEELLRALFPANLMMQISAVQSAVALTVGLVALASSTLHLGRPLAAWRAIIGLRTSWLSREIIAFGLFAALAFLSAARFWAGALQHLNSDLIGSAVVLTGLLGVFCSVMIYHDTRCPSWNGPGVTVKFYGTTLILGVAAALFATTLQGLLSSAVAANGAYQQLTFFLARILILFTALKLAFESTTLLPALIGIPRLPENRSAGPWPAAHLVSIRTGNPFASPGESGGRFPLTPTLSLGERGNSRQQVVESEVAASSQERTLLLPLPEGEGRGEGEQSASLLLLAGTSCAPVPVSRQAHRGASSGLQATAKLLCGELQEITTGRFLLGFVGGVLLPLAFVVQRPAPGVASLGVTVGISGFLLLGELLERYLFFTAVAPARMPGGIGS